jgi:hypothetical protein
MLDETSARGRGGRILVAGGGVAPGSQVETCQVRAHAGRHTGSAVSDRHHQRCQQHREQAPEQ